LVLPVAGVRGDPFGMQRSFNGGPFSNHTGVDIIAGEGAPVVAANAGRVAYVGELHLRGNTIVIDHGAGVFTGYHHLSQIKVVAGQSVSQGEAIGAVGATGLVTGAHLHWELIVRGVRVDPLPWTQAVIGP
jgi:murein DD-endopeptidase MepM/ murein hydrolase activator NlpD